MLMLHTWFIGYFPGEPALVSCLLSLLFYLSILVHSVMTEKNFSCTVYQLFPIRLTRAFPVLNTVNADDLPEGCKHCVLSYIPEIFIWIKIPYHLFCLVFLVGEDAEHYWAHSMGP